MWRGPRSFVERASFPNIPPSEYRRVRELLARNRDLQGAIVDRERCFIIATGPSVNAQDLSLLRGQTVIVLDNFHLHPDYDLLQPRFHCTADPAVGRDESDILAWHRDIGGKAHRAVMLLPAEAEPLVRRHTLYPGRSINYTFYAEEGGERGRIRGDLTRPVTLAENSVVGALLQAVYLRFRNVYLLGCDHDYLAHPASFTHFYGKEPHDADEGGISPYEIRLDSSLRLWRTYGHLRRFALSRGVRIFNATPGGHLDAFPRVNYERLMADSATGRPGDLPVAPKDAR